MGHIELLVPVVHAWYISARGSKIAQLLGIKPKELEQIIYYERYVVINPGPLEGVVEKNQLLTLDQYNEIIQKLPSENRKLDDDDPNKFVAQIGGLAVETLLKKIDLDELSSSLRAEITQTVAKTKKDALLKRLKVVEAFRKAEKDGANRPERMVVRLVPVIPPDLRPLVPLEGGRFATSDLNELYKKVIQRNNRLRKFLEIKAPALILRHEMRMLQEAVDALFDNKRKTAGSRVGAGSRKLKSLTEIISGKQGRFRQNLLGKRVDYSGRSVIVVGPELKLHECGVPKTMAAELFKPFIMRKLIERGIAKNAKTAKKLVDDKAEVIWEILENIMKGHPVLLNRAPTLHRLGIQAFQPKLIEGKAIQLHPLVCTGFNADFDGDQMAIHVPLTNMAKLEAMMLMLSSHNILRPSDGTPITVPSQDMVLGLYYLTKMRKPKRNEKLKFFASSEDILLAYNEGKISLHQPIEFRIPEEYAKKLDELFIKKEKEYKEELKEYKIKLEQYKKELKDYEDLLQKYKEAVEQGDYSMSEPVKPKEPEKPIKPKPFYDPEKRSIITTAGRIIFNNLLPEEIDFINITIGKKQIKAIIHQIFKTCGNRRTVLFLDRLKELGFYYAFKGGLSFRLSDIVIPKNKWEIINEALEKADEIKASYQMGLLSESEKYNQLIDLWTHVINEIRSVLLIELRNDKGGFNPIAMMLDSGARGSEEQIRQLGGLRGLMQRPQKTLRGATGETIENPILSNFKEGLSVIEYFISTHGARKGLSDTALKTADAGYLTRKLVDVSQDVIIREEDCGTLRGITIKPRIKMEDGKIKVEKTLGELALGRTVLEDVYDPVTGELICEAGTEVDEVIAKKIDNSKLRSLKIRSVLTCGAARGVCVKCYGRNIAVGRTAQVGEAVGVMAAQSIGEPGTQLTLRTFHKGGTASGKAAEKDFKAPFDSILKLEGVKVVETEREIENPKTKKTEIRRVNVVISRGSELKLISPLDKKTELITKDIPYGAILFVEDGTSVKEGETLFSWDPYSTLIIAEEEGLVKYQDIIPGKSARIDIDEQTKKEELVIIQPRGTQKLQPKLLIIDEDGNIREEKAIPVEARIVVKENQNVKAGAILAKIPRRVAKDSDITGGLPRVIELFEARKPSDAAVLSEIDGIVEIGPTKGKRRIIYVKTRDGLVTRTYQVKASQHIIVGNNDFVKSGDPLTAGAVNPQDILAIKGILATQKYIIDEVQEVYKRQNVDIDNKHIEIIIKQMMQKVQIIDPGDTIFAEKEEVTKQRFFEENNSLIGKKIIIDQGDVDKVVSKEQLNQYKIGQIISPLELKKINSELKEKGLSLISVRDAKTAVAKPMLQGITGAALSTDSWLSAASFQQTKEVLSNAAIEAKVDYLHGLKENVIVGHLIPAGTGLRKYKGIEVKHISELEAENSKTEEPEEYQEEAVE